MSSSDSSSSESDSEGFDIIFKGGQIEINTPNYKSADTLNEANDSARLNSLIQENMQICEEIFNSLIVSKKVFFCFKKQFTDYISKLKELNSMPAQQDENYPKLTENIIEILGLLKYNNKAWTELSILELAILSFSLSNNYHQKLRLFLRSRTIESYCSAVKLFCERTIVDHEIKIKNFQVLREFIEYVCGRLAASVEKIRKSENN